MADVKRETIEHSPLQTISIISADGSSVNYLYITQHKLYHHYS